MWCHKLKRVTLLLGCSGSQLGQDHLSRFLHINYTKLFKQIMHYSSENMISSHSQATLKSQPWIRLRRKGRVGYVQGGKQGGTKVTPKSTVLIQLQNLLQVQRGKIHLATPELLLFFSPPRALLTRLPEKKQFSHFAKCATTCADLIGFLHASGKIQSLLELVSHQLSYLGFRKHRVSYLLWFTVI